MMLAAVEWGGQKRYKRELKGRPAGLNMERDLIWEVRERDTPRKADILILDDQENDGAWCRQGCQEEKSVWQAV